MSDKPRDKIKKDSLKKTLNELFEHVLPKDDLELVILKGHLFVEKQLNEILNIVLPNSPALGKDSDWTFDQRFRMLLASLEPNSFTDEIISSINVLNRLRNDIAHNLDKDIDDRLDAFVSDFELFNAYLQKLGISSSKKNKDNKYVDSDKNKIFKTKIGIVALCGILSVTKEDILST